ncbi:uncharacterized protein LOC116206467 [Punica granatum]|uniref:Uncharacterized protein LOC116206467 n=2 Tax=Punica granatum TaxID=22663 RepID=A0A6P8DLB4_PUNGR|nr:uncharacterized protein LOC116206467 [Punica granatum]PKI33409.1 hypothetical protein CRG98_046194 [Punica granatum]
MIKTLSPYNSAATTSKTAEILSRYRPIAPKPEIPATDGPTSPSSSSSPPSSMSQKIRQSPYLRNLWPQLQARPTRTRKRGRTAISPPAVKRQRTQSASLGIQPVPPPPSTTNACKSLSFQAFTGLAITHQLLPAVNTGIETVTASPRSLVTLPLLPCPNAAPVTSEDRISAPERGGILPRGEDQVIDLNLSTGMVTQIPEEKDLLRQLQEAGNTTNNGTVIAPQPLRPVGSSISVGSISKGPRLASEPRVPRKREEVEEEVESEELPAVISDSNNKVRLANSAYKEMVGQPECSWLESMVVGGSCGGDKGGPSCRRIGGEVMLRFSSGEELPVYSDGFSCWVRIEWGNVEGKKSSVRAFCEVSKLSCESKDYHFTWRFHTGTRSRALASQGPRLSPIA